MKQVNNKHKQQQGYHDWRNLNMILFIQKEQPHKNNSNIKIIHRRHIGICKTIFRKRLEQCDNCRQPSLFGKKKRHHYGDQETQP